MEQAEKLNPIETKLSAARTRLIIDKPFLGALVLRLPMVMGDPSWCRTTATDARKFYYNADFIDNLTLEETQFMLAHEALHCALSHFARRAHRIKMRWDLACDYAINPLLIKDGLKPPPNSMYMKEYEGMTAEEIYPLIDENSNDEPLDHHMYDDESKDGDNDTGKSDMPPPPDMEDQEDKQDKSDDEQKGEGKQQPNDSRQQQQPQPQDKQQQQGNGLQGEVDDDKAKGAPQPPPLTKAEQETLAIQWQQRMAGAAQSAMQAGKLGGEMARMVDHLLQPQLPWRMLLAKYMNAIARDDYSYTRPSSRRGDPAIYPSLRSSQADIVIAVDTSGSISDGEVEEFVSEINAIKGQMRARITLLACDSALAEECPWTYEAWDKFVMPEKIKGGGGTSFVPVFEWTENQDRQPELLVYFTDAEGEFPEHESVCPTIWLVKGKAKVPWGQRIQLN
ncbi:MAG: VWA-like domain-containing protein [Gammaproteobacteria bacterium]